MLGGLVAPLKVLSNAARDKAIFESCYGCFEKLVNSTEKRDEINRQSSRLERGRINFYNASLGLKVGQEKELISSLMNATESPNIKSNSVLGQAYNILINYLIYYFGSKLPKKQPVDEQPSQKVLLNITMDINKGEKVCISGNEGAGKTCLLLSLINELDLDSGNFSYNGRISHLNMKKPLWLGGRTLKENITMEGDSCDDKRFRRTCNVVHLDMKKFPGQEQNKVLSGGSNYSATDQRKILLARTLYQKSDIYLFDGVFDGLDAIEKKEFFTRICLRELKQQTVLFTCNERSLARLSDRIIVLNEGCIVEQGTIDEIDALGETGLFFQITNADNVMGGSNTGMSKLMESVDDAAIKRSKLSDVTYATEFGSKNTDERLDEANNAVHVEEDEVEQINLIQILKRYLLPVDYTVDFRRKTTKEFLIVCGSVFIGILSDIWLGVWSANVLGLSLSSYLVIYACLNIAQGGGILFRNLKVRFGLLTNGDKVHYTMIENIMRSTMRWFGVNPTPRIVGRFVGDTNTVDELLSETVISSIEAMVCVLAGALIFNMFYLGFLILITAILLGYLMYVLTLYFQISSSFYQISA